MKKTKMRSWRKGASTYGIEYTVMYWKYRTTAIGYIHLISFHISMLYTFDGLEQSRHISLAVYGWLASCGLSDSLCPRSQKKIIFFFIIIHSLSLYTLLLCCLFVHILYVHSCVECTCININIFVQKWICDCMHIYGKMCVSASIKWNIYWNDRSMDTQMMCCDFEAWKRNMEIN